MSDRYRVPFPSQASLSFALALSLLNTLTIFLFPALNEQLFRIVHGTLVTFLVKRRYRCETTFAFFGGPFLALYLALCDFSHVNFAAFG